MQEGLCKYWHWKQPNLLWWEYQILEKDRLTHHSMACNLAGEFSSLHGPLPIRYFWKCHDIDVLWETGACSKHHWEDELEEPHLFKAQWDADRHLILKFTILFLKLDKVFVFCYWAEFVSIWKPVSSSSCHLDINQSLGSYSTYERDFTSVAWFFLLWIRVCFVIYFTVQR